MLSTLLGASRRTASWVRKQIVCTKVIGRMILGSRMWRLHNLKRRNNISRVDRKCAFRPMSYAAVMQTTIQPLVGNTSINSRRQKNNCRHEALHKTQKSRSRIDSRLSTSRIGPSLPSPCPWTSGFGSSGWSTALLAD